MFRAGIVCSGISLQLTSNGKTPQHALCRTHCSTSWHVTHAHWQFFMASYFEYCWSKHQQITKRCSSSSRSGRKNRATPTTLRQISSECQKRVINTWHVLHAATLGRYDGVLAAMAIFRHLLRCSGWRQLELEPKAKLTTTYLCSVTLATYSSRSSVVDNLLF